MIYNLNELPMKKLLIILLMITLPLSAQSFIEQEDKQLHFTAGSIIGATGYIWSYQKHYDKKRAMITGILLKKCTMVK